MDARSRMTGSSDSNRARRWKTPFSDEEGCKCPPAWKGLDEPFARREDGRGKVMEPIPTTIGGERTAPARHRHRCHHRPECRPDACEVARRHLAGRKAAIHPLLRRGVMGGGAGCCEGAKRLCLVTGGSVTTVTTRLGHRRRQSTRPSCGWGLSPPPPCEVAVLSFFANQELACACSL